MTVQISDCSLFNNKKGKQEIMTSFLDYLATVSKKSLRRLGLDTMNPLEFLRNYDKMSLEEITIDPNANIGHKKTVSNRISEMAKPWLKMRGLEELYEGGKEMFGNSFTLDPVFNGRVYIHDSTKLDRPYCIGASTIDIVLDGRPYAGLEGVPPKHFDAFMGQVTEYTMDLSKKFAGAVAPSDWPIAMAWYADKENIPMKCNSPNKISIEQSWQSRIHILHNPWRIDNDSPYTNVSINSPRVLDDMFKHYTFPDGKTLDDIFDTVMNVQRTILDFMYKGDPKKGGLQYKFPVMTCNFKPDDVGDKWWDYVAGLNHKGFVNFCLAEMFSSCCRLLSNVEEMLKYKNYSNGSGGIKIGSHRVIALNLPGIADDCILEYGGVLSLEDTWKQYERNLDYYIEQVIKYLIVHKIKMLKPRIDQGMFAFFSEFENELGEKTGRGPWLHLNMLFSTIGIHGLPDAVDILLGGEDNILTNEGLWLAKKIVSHVVDKASEFSGIEENGTIMFFNVEQVPAESASHTMASFDGKKIYSNQFVPLDTRCDIWERVRIEGELSSMMTGGSMTFLSLEKMMTPEQSIKFHTRVAEYSKKKLNQFCINYGWSVDEKHALVGKYDRCPICNKKMRQYERVVGYMVKTENINHPRVENELEKRYRHVI